MLCCVLGLQPFLKSRSDGTGSILVGYFPSRINSHLALIYYVAEYLISLSLAGRTVYLGMKRCFQLARYAEEPGRLSLGPRLMGGRAEGGRRLARLRRI